MIQRIQSVYLFLVLVLTAIFMTGTVYSFPGQPGKDILVTFSGRHAADGTMPFVFNWLTTILTSGILALALLSIFLYKNRKTQSFLVMLTALISLGLSVLILVKGMGITGESSAKAKFALRAFLPFVNLILLLLALRGIKKDEELVRSYDRLR